MLSHVAAGESNTEIASRPLHRPVDGAQAPRELLPQARRERPGGGRRPPPGPRPARPSTCVSAWPAWAKTSRQSTPRREYRATARTRTLRGQGFSSPKEGSSHVTAPPPHRPALGRPADRLAARGPGRHVRDRPPSPQAPDQHGECPGRAGLGTAPSRPSTRPTPYPWAYRSSATPPRPCRRRNVVDAPSRQLGDRRRRDSRARRAGPLRAGRQGRTRRPAGHVAGRGPRRQPPRTGGSPSARRSPPGSSRSGPTTATTTRRSTTRWGSASGRGGPSHRPSTCSVPGSARWTRSWWTGWPAPTARTS